MEFSVYLMFNGECEEAMNFYREALGAEMKMMQRYGESPMPSEDPEWNQKIMHCGIQKDGFLIMASDSRDKNGGIINGNNVHISLNFMSEEEISSTFEAISAGGQITMPLQDTFWGAKFGMCTDRFGVGWMFNYDHPKVPGGKSVY
jgi:PhnB protein